MKLKDFDCRIWKTNSSPDDRYEAFDCKHEKGDKDLEFAIGILKFYNEPKKWQVGKIWETSDKLKKFGAKDINIRDAQSVYMFNNYEELEIEFWTGLLDCKGNKIYENDIVRIKGGVNDDIALVKLDLRDGVRFVIKIKGKMVSWQYVLDEEATQKTIEVIGNIHENAELFVEKSKVKARTA